MNTQKMDDLKEKLCRELETFTEKGSLSAGDVSLIHDMLSSVKNIDKIKMVQEGGYSQGGDWRADIYGSYGNSYARGRNSMGQFTSRGYSRDGYSHDGYAQDGYSRDGYSRDGYSRDGNPREMLERMMENARSDKEKDALRRAMEAMR